MTNRYELAEHLYSLGFSVLPLSDKKTPVVKWKPLQTQRCTPADLVEWFQDRGFGPALSPANCPASWLSIVMTRTPRNAWRQPGRPARPSSRRDADVTICSGILAVIPATVAALAAGRSTCAGMAAMSLHTTTPAAGRQTTSKPPLCIRSRNYERAAKHPRRQASRSRTAGSAPGGNSQESKRVGARCTRRETRQTGRPMGGFPVVSVVADSARIRPPVTILLARK